MARMRVSMPDFIDDWKNMSVLGAVRYMNKDMDIAAADVEEYIKDLIPQGPTGDLKDSVTVEARLKMNGSINFVVDSYGAGEEYFWQRDQGGSIGWNVFFAPKNSPFYGQPDASQTAYDLQDNPTPWRKVFKMKGSNAVVGEQRDGELEVLFIFKRQVYQHGEHFVDEGIRQSMRSIKRVASDLLREYVISKG